MKEKKLYFSFFKMGALKLTYYHDGNALAEKQFFLLHGKEKNENREKKYKDYYTGGSLLPGRSFNSNKYSFGFNGKLKDDQWYNVTGSMYDYGFRMYDSRIIRFNSVDPLTKKYPMLTPYQFASNTPIWGVDLDGLEVSYSTTKQNDGSTLITITYDYKVKKSSEFISNYSVFKAAVNIKNQMEKSMKAYDPKTNTYYQTKVNLDFNSTPVQGKDLYLDFVNEITYEKDGVKYTSSAVGRVDEIGNTNVNRVQILLEKDAVNKDPDANLQTTKEIRRTGTHDSGHVVGLYHPDDKDNKIKVDNPNNVMYQSEDSKGTDINIEQMKEIINTIDNNNKK